MEEIGSSKISKNEIRRKKRQNIAFYVAFITEKHYRLLRIINAFLNELHNASYIT